MGMQLTDKASCDYEICGEQFRRVTVDLDFTCTVLLAGVAKRTLRGNGCDDGKQAPLPWHSGREGATRLRHFCRPPPPRLNTNLDSPHFEQLIVVNTSSST
jgi:hypothetical protein